MLTRHSLRFLAAALAVWLGGAAPALCHAAPAAPPPAAAPAPAAVSNPAEWAVYRGRFVTPEGRVLDSGNHNVSHTEGQGWAMLFAETYGDRATFDRMWTWTRDRLQQHDSALFSWRWDPATPKDPVADANDASDGDILIAWALARAASHWHDPAYRLAARRIILDIRRRLIFADGDRRVLLPGQLGFRSKNGDIVVNPSYYIYPAFRDFARIVPSRDWWRLRRDGLALLADSRFGKWKLPPDWVVIDGAGNVAPASGHPPRFGFDAIRVPLYLMWGRVAPPSRLAAFLDFWKQFGDKPVPAWVDVETGKLAPYAGSTGVQAIVQLARTYRRRDPAPMPVIGAKDDYYSASLTLLARMVRSETTR